MQRALGKVDMLVMGQRKKEEDKDGAMSGNIMGTSPFKEGVCTQSVTRSTSLTHCSLSGGYFFSP